MMMMENKGKYILGIKFTGCDEKTQKYCIWKRKNGNCIKSLNDCQYPISSNPLCFCPSVDKCAGRYSIQKKGKDTYLLYQCHNGCNFFIKNYKENAPKLLKALDKDNIYYGESLDKLVKDIFKENKKINKVKGDSDIVNFFDELFTKLAIGGD